jgi:hypothetical protein
MLLGMSIVTFVGSLRGDIMERIDDTPLNHRLSKLCWRNGVRYKTWTLLVPDGAEGDTSEKQIVRSVYRKMMIEYWATLRPEFAERAQRMSKYVKVPDPE